VEFQSHGLASSQYNTAPVVCQPQAGYWTLEFIQRYHIPFGSFDNVADIEKNLLEFELA
jgi:hypothetical protein